MSEELEIRRNFNKDLMESLKVENEITINALNVEDVVEYAEESMKFTGHDWQCNLSSAGYEVTRDGVEIPNVTDVRTDWSKDGLPRLIVETEFNGFELRATDDGCSQVYFNGEWIEEVESYEIVNDPQNNYVTHLRMTLLTDCDLHMDYKVERGERENPNINFVKVNYHKNPLLTETAYQQALGEVKQLEE